MTIKEILASLLIVVTLSCANHKPGGFVYIENSQFKLNGSPYFPVLMNYMVSLREVNDTLTVSPTLEYDSPHEFYGNTLDEAFHRIEVHFKAIQQMGFNSIRLVGFNKVTYEMNQDSTMIGSLTFFDKDTKRKKVDVLAHQNEIISALDKIIQIANGLDLKVMILLPRPRKSQEENQIRLNYIEYILKSFQNRRTVFAYDFFNEPIYFDNAEFTNYQGRHREKEDADRLVKGWKKLMTKYAPKQLLTIGFSEPIEVFEWDPNILSVDFVSIHTYHPLRVPNEIYWFSKYLNKPWMITETSLPADNDSIPYESQAIFMKEALQRTIDCGGAGFGWWQYQDVAWGPFEHDYTAIVNGVGVTVIDELDTIYGTIKPAANVLKNFDFSIKGKCNCHQNYYNMLGYENYRINGKVINELTNEPIEGAVIRGWNANWSIGMNTFSNEHGEFTLYSNDECVNFEISALGTSTSKFQLRLEYDTLDSYYTKGLANKKLEYHSIHYQSFMKEGRQSSSVFDFDSSLFQNYRLKTEMPPIKLKVLNL